MLYFNSTNGYTFNKNAYKKALKAKLKLGFINNWRY